jgi:DNA primase large subunit
MDSLSFSQKFPFTENAKKYLKEKNVQLEDVSEEQIKKAALIISRANQSKDYMLDVINPTNDVLEREIIAFPISKLLVSSINTPNILEKFADLFRKKTFEELLNEKNILSSLLLLADDFKINYSLKEEFVLIPLLEYLDIYFVDEESKLVNKKVENSVVLLNINDFARFLSEKTFKKIFDSLPIKKELIPKKFVSLSKNISSQLNVIQQKNYSQKISGKIKPELFPPSMIELYNKQLVGEKLSYYERLTIGGFLQQIGMQKQEMTEFFSKSPDYKKHIADYHIKRIFEIGLSAPSYKKMDEYGIIVSQQEKKYFHPLKYYLTQLKINNKKKNLEKKY